MELQRIDVHFTQLLDSRVKKTIIYSGHQMIPDGYYYNTKSRYARDVDGA